MTTELDRAEVAAATDYEALVLALVGGPGNFPEAALRQCQQHSAAVTPLLIRSIEQATERKRAGEEPVGDVHIFALYLLWEFQAEEALPAILAAISLPGDGPFELFGDGVTEDLSQILAAFAGDKPAEFLDDLIVNRALNDSVRWAACSAYCYLVRDGKLAREVAVERLRQHLRTAIDLEELETPGFLVSELCNLNPQEALAEIREAYDRELVEEFLIDREFAESAIARGAVESEEELARLGPTLLADTVEHLRHWFWFQPREPRVSRPFSGPQSSHRDKSEPFQDSEFMPSVGSTTIRNESPRVGRNDPCPCGSGKKFKKCCLRSEPLL